MYINIFKIVLKNKINLKLDFLIKILDKFKIHINSKYILLFICIIFNYLSCIFIALGFYYLSRNINPRMVLVSIFITISIRQFYIGITEYKSCFICMFQDLKDMSLATDKKVYKTLLSADLVYQAITSSEIFLATIVVFIVFGINFNSIIYALNILSISLFSYICGNLIAGKYVYSKVVKKIGVLRLLVYLFFSILIWSGIFNLLKNLIYYINTIVIKKFNTFNDILSDSLWKTIFKEIELNFFDILHVIENNLILCFDFINLKSCIFIVIATIIILNKVKVNMIPKDNNLEFNHKNDIFYKYHKILNKLFKFKGMNKLLFKYQTNDFVKYRWLFSNNFFELFFINYEATCYTAIFTSLIINSNNQILSLQLLICMSLMVLANQSFELRINAYPYFSLTKEKLKLELIKTSILDNNELFNVKLNSFRMNYILHVCIMVIYSIVVGIIVRLPIMNILIIVLLDIMLFFIMSLVQIHVIPIAVNFNYIDESQIGTSFEEEELANKIQELPRMFLVVIPMILTFFILFIPRIRLSTVIYIELIYLIVCSAILHKYMTIIIKKGMKNLYEKILN